MIFNNLALVLFCLFIYSFAVLQSHFSLWLADLSLAEEVAPWAVQLFSKQPLGSKEKGTLFRLRMGSWGNKSSSFLSSRAGLQTAPTTQWLRAWCCTGGSWSTMVQLQGLLCCFFLICFPQVPGGCTGYQASVPVLPLLWSFMENAFHLGKF